MCIRDRVNPVNPVGSVYTKNELSQLADIAIRHDLLVVTDAVSYTRLRAHETVLDLVCRLLLEKKNNN